MKDAFSKYYLIFTIIFGLLGLLEVTFFFKNTFFYKLLIIYLSLVDIVFIVISVLYVFHIKEKQLKSHFKILPQTFILYYILFSIIGILLVSTIGKGNFLYVTQEEIMVNRILWIISGCYSLFQVFYATYLLKLRES